MTKSSGTKVLHQKAKDTDREREREREAKVSKERKGKKESRVMTVHLEQLPLTYLCFQVA